METKQRHQEMQYSCSMDNVAFLMTTEDPRLMECLLGVRFADLRKVTYLDSYQANRLHGFRIRSNRNLKK